MTSRVSLKERKRRRKERDKHRRAHNRHVTRFLEHVRADATKAYYDRSLKPADMREACLRVFVPPLEYAYIWVVYPIVFKSTWVDIRARSVMIVSTRRKKCLPGLAAKNIPQE